MPEELLADLLPYTKDGEWGYGEPHEGCVPMRVIRGTDFADVRYGDLRNLPLRYIPSEIATRKTLQPSDILIETAGGTKDQPTGRTVLLDEGVFAESDHPLTCASFSRFLRVDQTRIRPDYLFWFLQYLYSSGDMYAYHVQHTGVARFQYTQFAKQTKVPIIDPEEQAELAKLLNALDQKIRINCRMNHTLMKMAEAVFKDWFVHFGPTLAKEKGGSQYLTTEVWEAFPSSLDDSGKPIGWEESQIGLETECVGGGTPSTTNPSFWDGDINWVTPKDLSRLNTPVLLSTERRITPEGLSKISSGLLPPGTVLLSSRAPIGYLAIAECPLAINQGFIALRCNGRLSNLYVWQWLGASVNAILEQANGSTFQEINKTNFRPIPIIVPPQQLREAFDGIIRPLYEQIRLNEVESLDLARTRDLLLPRLLSGEITFSDAKKHIERVL